MSGPLDGVRVVELAAVLSGPLATMILADQGADVVKIERPGLGDVLRAPNYSRGGLSSFFLNCNRGKRSVVVDTDTPQGRRIVLELAARADVMIQNYRPGVVDRMGLGYDDVRAVNEAIVYVSISGYGSSGPYRDRRVYDPILQGLTGHVAAQCNPEVPIRDLVRNVIADKATAWAVAQAIPAALFARERGAGGQHIEVPMLDASLAFFWPDGMMAHTFLGDDHPPGRPLYETYSLTPTADAHLIYFVVGNEDTAALLRALGCAEAMEDPRFCDVGARIANGEAFGALLRREFAKWPTAEIIARLAEEGVAAGPVLDFDAVMEDAQVVHNGSVVERDHPTAGPLREVRHPIRFGAEAAPLNPVAPLHGEHTDAVLAELGYDPVAIAELRGAGAVT